MSQARSIHANLLLVFCSSNVSMGCRRRQARQGFLLSTLLPGTPLTMNGEIAQNPNSGEARHAIRQGSRHSFAPYIQMERMQRLVRQDVRRIPGDCRIQHAYANPNFA